MERTQRQPKKRRRLKKSVKRILLILCLLLVGMLFLTLKNTFFKGNTTTQSSSQTSSTVTTQNSSQTGTTSSVTWEKQDTEIAFPILMYHAIHVMAPEESSNANLIVAPDVFESHIKRLSEEGYYFLTPEEAYKVLTENVLPNGNSKIVWLTFDDSLVDFYNQAFPILQKYKATATNNVITGMTEEQLPDHLTLDELKTLKEAGISLESHTVNHPDLSVQDTTTQNDEMKESEDYLNSEFNQKTIAIAYPAGRYSDDTLSIASKYYKLGVTTNEGLASKSDGLLSLNRVRILPTTTADDLINTISQ